MQVNTPEQFQRWFAAHHADILMRETRQLIVLLGDFSWSISLLEQVNTWHDEPDKDKHWYIYCENDLDNELKHQFNANITQQNVLDKLGTECNFVVYAANKMNIDIVSALSGALKAGGVFFLLFPAQLSLRPPAQDIALAENNAQHSQNRFLQRFFQKIQAGNNHLIIEQGNNKQFAELEQKLYSNGLPFANHSSIAPVNKDDRECVNNQLSCVTSQQFDAVKAIIKVVSGHRNRPLILTADRGRGKSSALAIACVELFKSAKLPMNIVITSGHINAFSSFFKQLKHDIPSAQFSASRVTVDIHNDKHHIEFWPIDQLLKTTPKATLVLVDEAAGIPIYLLEKLLTHYQRLVFSSTVHGYEGAGRGFTLKFVPLLKQRFPDAYQLHITQPIRWHEEDPLERFIFDLCLLNTDLQEMQIPSTSKVLIRQQNEQALAINLQQVIYKLISQEELMADEVLLKQVFAVLVTAHYQTKPSDLQMLLDHPKISVHCIFFQKQVIGVSLLMLEGQCEAGLSNQVLQSEIRLRDQFLPQSLLLHCGIKQALELSYLRIMRIAVHPSCQQQGIGHYLLEHLGYYAEQHHVDFIGTSFGANPQLLNFWLKADYQQVRLGFNQDASSGEFSALMLRAVSKQGEVLLPSIQQIFYRSFAYLLNDEYKQVSDELVWLILHCMPIEYRPILSDFDLETVSAFAKKERLYSACVYSLHLWFIQQVDDFHPDVLPIISRLLKKNPLEVVCQQYQLKRKKAFNQLCIDYVAKRLDLG